MIKPLKEREAVLKERLDELCGDEQGEHCDCLTRSNDKVFLFVKSGFNVPEEEEIPEWLGVTRYKIWYPWSDKRIAKKNV